MSGLEIAGLAGAVISLCIQIAEKLNQFREHVKDAARMVDSVKALERSLGSMQALFQKHKNYLDSMEKTYWETIRGCLVTCKADLKILQDKLPPPPKESNPHFWENAKAAVANFFQRGCAALSVGDIQVIQNNVQKSIEVVRLHVELLTCYSGFRTREGVYRIEGGVGRIEDVMNHFRHTLDRIERQISGVGDFDDLSRASTLVEPTWTQPSEDVHASALPINEVRSRRLVRKESLCIWKSESKSMVRTLVEALAEPVSCDEDSPPASLSRVHSSRDSAIDVGDQPQQPSPSDALSPPLGEEPLRMGEIESQLISYEHTIAKNIEVGDYEKAAENRARAIKERTQLAQHRYKEFSFSDRSEMNENLVDIYVKLGTSAAKEEAASILLNILTEGECLLEGGDTELRARLFHKLGDIHLQLENLHEAARYARNAIAIWLTLRPKPPNKIKESAVIRYQALIRIPDPVAVGALVRDMTRELGEPFQPPDDPDDNNLLQWSRKIDQDTLTTCPTFGKVANGASSGPLSGYTAIRVAVEEGNVDILRKMLRYPRNLEVKLTKPDCLTPLHLACSKRHVAIVQLLLDKGALVNAKDGKGRTGLHHAVNTAGDGVAVARTLLKYGGGGLINEPGESGKTATYMAAQKGDLKMLAFLLRHGGDPNQRHESGMTPLMGAVEAHPRNLADVVKLLLDGDANANLTYTRRNKMVTAYMMAQKLGTCDPRVIADLKKASSGECREAPPKRAKRRFLFGW